MKTHLPDRYTWFFKSISNSYSQIFFSENIFFSILLFVITFFDFYTGLFGLFSVVITNISAYLTGFEKAKIQKGLIGFNSLLVGLGLGVNFEPGLLLLVIVFLSSIITLFLSVSIEGILNKYYLPYLSIPFVIVIWLISLACREFQALGLSERGIYTLNELYVVGGDSLVCFYNWWNDIQIPDSVRAYFLSLAAIFFQNNIFAGILVSIGLIFFSRIGFTLSVLGFYTAFFFYSLLGAEFTSISYSYIGFNYILTAIAVGGFFIIPDKSSYLWVIVLIPIVCIITFGLSNISEVFFLPVYSLPFCIVTLLFLYSVKFRTRSPGVLNPVVFQQNSPEKNLYSFLNYKERFGKNSIIPIYLPFFGKWTITQGHNGKHTHKDNWQYAWDFEITDEKGKTYKNSGDEPGDYYCYDKPVISPGDGIVEMIIDDIPDNIVGERNLEKNWGNSIVIKHTEYLYSSLSHLKPGSISVKEGDKVKRGETIGLCGNSGNSPYPHLHFQIQKNPFLGSHTTEYPISNYLLFEKEESLLKTVAIPAESEIVSNIQNNPSLSSAFKFIPGETITLTKSCSPENKIIWNIKQDLFLNKYIECEQTGSKAYFFSDENMFYFTHFSGDKNSLLYFFFLAAFKVCLGSIDNLILYDRYPLNSVFSYRDLFLQDFISPFYRFLKGEFILRYHENGDSVFNKKIFIESGSSIKIFGKQRRLCSYKIITDQSGWTGFEIKNKKHSFTATCIKE